VAVPGPGVRQPRPALCAQPGTIFPAQRRERQGEHHGIAKHGLEIEQVAVEEVNVPGRFADGTVVIGAIIAIGRRVCEEFLETDLEVQGQRLQAAGTIAGRDRSRRTGDKHALHHRLEPEIQLDAGALGDASKLNTETSRCRDGRSLGMTRSRLTAE